MAINFWNKSVENVQFWNTPIKSVYYGSTKVRPSEEVVFDYDFTTTNPSSELLWYHATYWYEYVQWSWLRTYNISSNDKGWYCWKLIEEDLSNKTIIMEWTWLAEFWSTWTWFWFAIKSTKSREVGAKNNGIWATLNTTYSGSSSTYDDFSAPEICVNGSWQWNKIKKYGRKIATSWSQEVKIRRELNLKNWTSVISVYKNWSLLSTENYTLTSSELNTVKWVATRNNYLIAEFWRWYRSVTMFIKSWKIMIKD